MYGEVQFCNINIPISEYILMTLSETMQLLMLVS
jgi:hypothetical protein